MSRKVFILLFITALFSGSVTAEEVNISGSVSQGYLNTTEYNFLADDSKDGTLKFAELNLNISKAVTSKFNIGIGINSRSLGSKIRHEPLINWVYGDYYLNKYIGIRGGRLKTPQGLYNETRDMDMFRTSIFLPSGVYPEGLRDLTNSLDGFGIYGILPLSVCGSLSYSLIWGTADVAADGTTVGLYEDRLRSLNPSINSFVLGSESYSFHLKWETPLEGFELGGTYNNIGDIVVDSDVNIPVDGEDPITHLLIYGDDTETFTYFCKYSYGDFTLSSEYYILEMTNRFLTVKSKTHMEGWYINPTYRFNDLFEMGIYYSEFYPTTGQKDTVFLEDTCLSLRFDILNNWILKLEGHGMRGIGYVQVGINPDNDFSEKNWQMYAAKMTFFF